MSRRRVWRSMASRGDDALHYGRAICAVQGENAGRSTAAAKKDDSRGGCVIGTVALGGGDARRRRRRKKRASDEQIGDGVAGVVVVNERAAETGNERRPGYWWVRGAGCFAQAVGETAVAHG